MSVSAAETEDTVEFPADDMIRNVGDERRWEERREKEVQSNLYVLLLYGFDPNQKNAEPKSNLTVIFSV